MSHTKTILLSVAALLTLIMWQPAYSQFFKSYDYGRTQYAYSIEKNSWGLVSGRWTVAGVTDTIPGTAGGWNWMFLKLSSTGSVICSRILGMSRADSCFSHIQFYNNFGRNVLAGFYRTSTDKQKASFTILDSSCNHVISKQILDSARHEYRQVVKNTADFFTMAGYIETLVSPGVYKNRILASQYNPGAALMWAYRYIPPYTWVDERAYSVAYQPSDGSYAITGVTNRFTGATGPYQVFVMKVSPAGIPIWFKGYSPVAGAPSQSRKIIALPDGSFVITGSSTAYDPAGDVFIFKIDATGAVLWSNTYGMPGITEQSESIILNASDASLVYTGSVTPAAGSEDILLGKVTSAAGFPVWTRRYPNPAGPDRGYDLKDDATSPVGFSVTGKLYHPTSISLDPFFLRTDASGKVTPTCQDSVIFQPRPGYWSDVCTRQIMQLADITIQPMVYTIIPAVRTMCGTISGITAENEIPNSFALKQNYPNPFNPSTVIEFSVPQNSNVSITVFDAAGRLVEELVNGFKPAGNYSVDFNASGLSSGVYFYKLKTEGFEKTMKMLLVK